MKYLRSHERKKSIIIAYQVTRSYNKERYNVGSCRAAKQIWFLLILPFLIDQNYINNNMCQLSSVLDKKKYCNSVSDLINVGDQFRDRLRMI